MAETGNDRIETRQLTLVRATLPILEAEGAYFEACQRWYEVSETLPLMEWDKCELAREPGRAADKLKALLGADDLADNSWSRSLLPHNLDP